MEISTNRFGCIEIDKDKVLTISKGILGFPNHKNYVLLPHKPDSPFFWLQSTEAPELAFVVTHPANFFVDYSFDIPDNIQEELAIADANQVEVFVIVAIPQGNPAGITVNLLGPLVINADKKIGCQLVLDPIKYPVSYPLVKS